MNKNGWLQLKSIIWFKFMHPLVLIIAIFAANASVPSSLTSIKHCWNISETYKFS